MFPRLEYLEWIHGRPETALHDLGGSDLRGTRQESTVLPTAVEERDEPPAGVTLETLLATIYGVEPECVLVTAGASHANFLVAATAIQDDRDRVLVERPGFEPLVKTPRGLGATVDRFGREPEDEYALRPEAVGTALDGSTALASVTNRHNPSGRLTDRETLEALAETVSASGARLLVDEVYAPYCRGDSATGPFGGPTAAGLEGVAVTGSLTKFFGFGDLNVGWLIADPVFIEDARTVLAHVPTVAETSRAMAARLLYDREALVERSRELVVDHADRLTAFVEERPHLSGPVFEGSSFAFLEHESLDGNELAEVAAEAGILVVPGRFFDEPSRIRVSLGREATDVEAALRAFGSVLDEAV